MKAADVANQRQPRGRQRVFIFLSSFFFSFWSRLYSSVKKFSGERLTQSGVHLPKFLIFAFSWLQSRRKNVNFHAGKNTVTLSQPLFCVVVFFQLELIYDASSDD